MKVKYKVERTITVQEWDHAVQEIYGRIYSLQQQDGCRERGIVRIRVPDNDAEERFGNDTVEDEVGSRDMGVSFAAWLAKDPHEPSPNQIHDFELRLWWQRNFYPDIQMVANDLHERGLLEEGDYTIIIDW